MAYKITDNCISCEAECGNDAISEGKEIYVIDADRCTECIENFESPKCSEVCPVDACVSAPDHEENKEQLLEKWHSLHPGETPAYEP